MEMHKRVTTEQSGGILRIYMIVYGQGTWEQETATDQSGRMKQALGALQTAHRGMSERSHMYSEEGQPAQRHCRHNA